MAMTYGAATVTVELDEITLTVKTGQVTDLATIGQVVGTAVQNRANALAYGGEDKATVLRQAEEKANKNAKAMTSRIEQLEQEIARLSQADHQKPTPVEDDDGPGDAPRTRRGRRGG